MFIKKSFVDEIADSLEINLDLAYKREEIKTEANRKSVLNYLTVASGILDEIGLEKEAVNVIKVLKKIADADPAAPKSSEQALSNLEHKGWMFNTDDEVQCADDDEEDGDGDEPQMKVEQAETSDFFGGV